MSPEKLIYECPRCGQGALEVARLKSTPPVEVVACAECDSTWISPTKVGFSPEADLSELLERLGLEISPSSRLILREGVPAEMIAEEYRSFLAARDRATDL